MSKRIPAGKLSEIEPGAVKKIEHEDLEIALINLNGELFAINDICSHSYANLSEGEISGDEIECPLHGAKFCVRTGEAKCAPALVPVSTYPVHILGDEIELEIP